MSKGLLPSGVWHKQEQNDFMYPKESIRQPKMVLRRNSIAL